MSRDFYFSFDAHILQGISLVITATQNQLFTSLTALSKDAYPVTSINHGNLFIAVWIYLMVSKMNFVVLVGYVIV